MQCVVKKVKKCDLDLLTALLSLKLLFVSGTCLVAVLLFVIRHLARQVWEDLQHNTNEI